MLTNTAAQQSSSETEEKQKAAEETFSQAEDTCVSVSFTPRTACKY